MFVLQEFELFESEGYVLAIPCNLDGGTEGVSYEDAAAMAADWLKGMAEHWLMTGTVVPKPVLGNAPQHGGRILLVGVEVSLAAIDAVTATEAAALLGVSRPRITQLISTGGLEGYRQGRNTYVTKASIQARLGERPSLRTSHERFELLQA